MEPIGREDELADIVARVRAGRRLVTIAGPGGIGKTTLARAACAALDGGTPEGRFVELSRVDRSDAVTGAIAADLGFAAFEVVLGSPELTGGVVVVDNCEHVADAAAGAVGALLRACPSLVILATSRSPLALGDESIVALAPLAVPSPGLVDATCGSVQLFRERARDAGVTLADHHLDVVGEICRRLDGMPLPIELAAARLRSMSLGEILARLGEGIDVLQRPRYRGAVRHRSVRDTINWSIDLLDDLDRVAFTRLSVCPGLFDVAVVDALADVTEGEGLELIGRLVDASLVVVDHRSTPTRYRLLEPIRAVALDLLDRQGELHAARERLTTDVHDRVSAVAQRATQVWWADLLPDLMASFDQIDSALRHCLDHDTDPSRAQMLYMILWGAVHQARVDDVLALGELVMRRWPDTGPGAATDVVATYAMGKLLCGHAEDAQELAERALPNSAGSWAAATGLRRVLALAARYRGDHEQAAALLEEAADAAARNGAVTFDLECRTYRAQDLAAMGHTEEALGIVEAAAADAARRGSILNEIWARTVQASVLATAVTPALDQARQVATDALSASERIAYPFGVSCNIQTIALCHLASGATSQAAASAERLLDAFARSGLGDFRRALDVAAAVLHAAGHPSAPHLVATARRLPDTNPMVVHLELPPPSAAATILDRSTATGVVRAALAAVRSEPSPRRPNTSGERPPTDPRFVRAGDLWDLTFDETTVHITATKGMDDLATLLAVPGRDVHCVDLAGGVVEQPATGTVIDTTARRQYEARIRELQADIDEADRHHDVGRADRARAELDALVDHLTAALGLGGKARTAGSSADRARSAVTHRIRSAVDRIDAAHPALGRHLRTSLITGTYCSYRPDPPLRWQVRTSRP